MTAASGGDGEAPGRGEGNGVAGGKTLRCYMNLMAVEDLPPWSAGPQTSDLAQVLEAVREAGYDGVQFVAPIGEREARLCEGLDLGRCSLGRVNEPREADELAARLAGEGQECGTLHVGWGMEDEARACALVESVLAASERRRIPLYVETHRATIFQDTWRTVQIVRRYPQLRFNGDFSHWYTGLEMVYGGFETKLGPLAPVLDRVRFVHGRIGSPGCMQVALGDDESRHQPYVGHFQRLWTASFAGYLRDAAARDPFLFVPELLSPRIFYARVFPSREGVPREEGDRWTDSFTLCRIARECWTAAQAG
jgi:hypothetical protein